MKNLDIWAGTVVHEVIEEILKGVKNGKSISKSKAFENARKKLRNGWKKSKREVEEGS